VHSEREGRKNKGENKRKINEKREARLQKRKLLATTQSTVQQAHKFPSCSSTLKM
jgi:hypothetical protein